MVMEATSPTTSLELFELVKLAISMAVETKEQKWETDLKEYKVGEQKKSCDC